MTQVSKTFWNIHTLFIRLEQQYVRTLPENLRLTINELHILEAIAVTAGQTMSEVASALHVTMPTLTVSITRLVEKGFVTRIRLEDDRRKIALALSEIGEEVHKLHLRFQETLSKEFVEHVANAQDSSTQEFLSSAMDFLSAKLEQN